MDAANDVDEIEAWDTEPCPTCGKMREVVNPAWLRHLRQEAGYSLRELGKRLHLSAGYLSDIELGRRRCSSAIRDGYRIAWTRRCWSGMDESGGDP